MRMNKALLFLASTLSLSNSAQGQGTKIYEVHGSGTTNPSKCIWHIMSLFNQQTKVPVRMTYRAVGSSTGQAEFLGVNNTDASVTGASSDFFHHWPHTDFGAGDIPISSDKYQALQDSISGSSAKKMVHLPFALSSVSFFYNLDGVGEIDLDGCLLAKIFARKITKWNDPEILASNPSLEDEDVDISVCRRTLGSSSTKSITKFLNIQCPNEWSSEDVGSVVDNWDPETISVYGSGKMTECISGKNGAIGYLESGHGWSESLQEISLKNKDGFYTTSKKAFEDGGIKSAAEDPPTPTDARSDWGDVEFINMGGKKTFPIVLMSYVYVRTDIATFKPDVHERALLKRFLESLYMDEYFGQCQQLAFTQVPQDIREVADKGINDINWELGTVENPSGENPWIFEIDTKKLEGTGDFVISSKRQSYQGVVLKDVFAMEEKLEYEIGGLNDLGHEIMLFTSKDSDRIAAALVLSALSFTLWLMLIVGYLVRRFLCGSSSYKYDSPQSQQPVHQI